MGSGPYQGPEKAPKGVGDVTNYEGRPGDRKEPVGASPTPFIKKTAHPKMLQNMSNGEMAAEAEDVVSADDNVKKVQGGPGGDYGEPGIKPMYAFTPEAAAKKLKQGQTHNMDH